VNSNFLMSLQILVTVFCNLEEIIKHRHGCNYLSHSDLHLFHRSLKLVKVHGGEFRFIIISCFGVKVLIIFLLCQINSTMVKCRPSWFLRIVLLGNLYYPIL
jgi:hypothetical protein